MNRNLKAIGTTVLAAVMCASFTGCSKKEDNGVYVDKDGNVSVNESKFEDHVNSVFGGNSNNASSSTKPEESKAEEIKIKLTDEIKNAALNSGLVQYNNDIFQRGGYITVADFVEKYKDIYDITYSVKGTEEGTYEECKDYLLAYDKDEGIFEYRNTVGDSWKNRDGIMTAYAGNDYSLMLKPKKGSKCNPVTAYVVNVTSPDEKITLDKAIVVEIESAYSRYLDCITPEWFPMGLNRKEFKDEYESENKSYTVKTLGEALEAKGLKKNANFEQKGQSVPISSKAENFDTYWSKNGERIGCYILGETNLFGAKPLYYYSFNIDSNTDKLNYVECTLEYFVKE